MRKKPTLRDVARLAGVSPSSVSRVANGSAYVGPTVQSRVRSAASQLGIDLTKAMKSRIIVFLLGNRDVLHRFQARILAGAEEYCTSHGWELLFLSFHYPSTTAVGELSLPQVLNRRDTVRGVILGGTNPASLLLALHERKVPFSVLGNNVLGEWQPEQHDVVFSDDVLGAYEMTSYLISRGHVHIWYVGDVRFPWFARCFQGYQRAMAEAKLQARCSQIRSDRQELGYLAVKSLIASGEPVTAIFAGSDQVAHGVYRALRDFHLRVPDNISVAGFNDTEGAILHPTLSSVREFPEELGRHLAEFVTTRIVNPDLDPRQLCMPTELVIRESIRPSEALTSTNARADEDARPAVETQRRLG
ncbi:MAG: LacI family DNA-binding transcriptional regulator [Luteitalea sp.]|nr:LacI family DNA-binding transcriptional regulator [Luteitalea sp.]